MKRGLIGLLAALAACSSPEEMSAAVGPAAGAQAGAAQTTGSKAPARESAQTALERRLAADAKPFVMDEAEQDGEAQRIFAYSWPRQASAIPGLVSVLATDRDTRLAEQKSEWEDQRLGCSPDSGACRNNSIEVNWQVISDTLRFLSLSSSIYSYAGGAHGNYWRTSLVWDREAGEALEPQALFASPGALGEAIRPRVCRLLDREREERRGEPAPAGSSEWPYQCPGMEDTVIFLGSASGTRFDRIGVYYAPYVAGPYAEGDFEFTVPVNAAVLRAVKPVYREAFAAGS